MPSWLMRLAVNVTEACAQALQVINSRHATATPARNKQLDRRHTAWSDPIDTDMHCAKDQPNAGKTVVTPESPVLCSASRSRAILIAEDDLASGHFFDAALGACGWDATLARDGQAALAQARQRRFDVLLLDCHLPAAGAAHILAALRADPEAASHAAPAIATSAELDAERRRQLRRAGFAGVLSKPVTVPDLQLAVQALLPGPAGQPVAVLDDRAALESSGSPSAVDALRGLFAGELRRLVGEWDDLVAQPARLAERLHRLLASCGFCGAHALADACRRLKRQLADGMARPAELTRFRHALTLTLRELSAVPRHAVADDPGDTPAPRSPGHREP